MNLRDQLINSIRKLDNQCLRGGDEILTNIIEDLLVSNLMYPDKTFDERLELDNEPIELTPKQDTENNRPPDKK